MRDQEKKIYDDNNRCHECGIPNDGYVFGRDRDELGRRISLIFAVCSECEHGYEYSALCPLGAG